MRQDPFGVRPFTGQGARFLQIMEKSKSEEMNAREASLLSRDVYCVCFPQRDSLDTLWGELAAARQRFFQGGRKAVKVGRHEVVKGFDGTLRGKISRWGFYWKKTALGVPGRKGIALEEAFDQKNGTVLVARDLHGVIVSRGFFTKGHAWQKSEYYEPWDSGTAKVMFKPGQHEDTIERYDWDGEKKYYRSTLLHPAPYRPGTAEQALLNAKFGEPQLILSVTDGLLCYCPQQEAQAREQALADMKKGTVVLLPAWEIKEGAFLGDEGEEETNITFTSLEEYARIEPGQEEKAALPPQAAALGPSLEEAGPAADAISPPDEAEIEYILAGVKEEASLPAEEQGQPEEFPAQAPQEAPAAEKQAGPAPLPAVEDSAILPVVREAIEEAASAKGTAAKGEDRAILSAAHKAQDTRHCTDLEEGVILSAARQAKNAGLGPVDKEEETILAAARRAAGKSMAQEKDAFPRHAVTQKAPAGKGHPQRAGGIAAYEGAYQNGKRQGFGSSYYKSGDLSYAGFWKNDKKDGLGASFREGDHALHVSCWTQGKPGQSVALFDQKGSLRFGGRIISGKKEGAGVSINSCDGSVLVTKWSGGENTGMASAFDPEGNLLYYGSWKDGKRHGHGTEFDKNGGIIFDGEWRDGQYFNGILYQQPTGSSASAGPDWDGPGWNP